MDGLPLEMNRLFPTFPSLPALNHFAAAAGIEAAARLRDAIEGGGREEKGREERGRAIRKEKMSNKSPDIGSHFTPRRRRRGGGGHF